MFSEVIYFVIKFFVVVSFVFLTAIHAIAFLVSSDGGTESAALVDDNGSEEDYSYEDLCQANPRYLQPGGEQLAINEVLEFTHDSGKSWISSFLDAGSLRLCPLDSFLFPSLLFINIY